MAGRLHTLRRGLTKKNFVLVAELYKLDFYVMFVKSDIFYFFAILFIFMSYT